MLHAYTDIQAISRQRRAYLGFGLPSFCLLICLPSFCLMSFFFTSKAVNAAQSSLTLVQVAKLTIDNHFSDHPKTISEIVETLSKNIHPSYRHSKGLFITLSKHGKTRACWGQISGTENNLVAATAFTTEGALTKEYRYPPIKRQEVPGLDVQVTVIDRVEPVERQVSLHPLLDGLMVRSGGKAAVLLPGEASDGHYQVMQCKVKAGITPSEPCQMYRIKAHVFR
ncbi:AMMECR1 domain-containing protein [bacterium]|nr:AMMECR1 domain-containing protein [bacterium]MBP9806879.1 AMMECR1 domain-containing protein [bacterium]